MLSGGSTYSARRIDRSLCLRDLAISLCFANLAFLRVWTSLLAYTPANSYWLKGPPARAEYLATMVNVLLLGLLCLVLITAIRHAGPFYGGLARVALLVLSALPIAAVGMIVVSYFPAIARPLERFTGSQTKVSIAVGFLIALAALVPLRRLATRVSVATLLILSPFVPVTFLQAAWRIATWNDARFAGGTLAPPQRVTQPVHRVVWVVFDEWDQSVTFAYRRPDLRLPEIERLRSAALFATDAYPPAAETARSMPALTSGRLVQRAVEVDSNTLAVTFAGDDRPMPWSAAPSVFAKVRELGMNAGVVGFTHPYCRVLNRDLTSCFWEQLRLPSYSMGEGFGEILFNQNRGHLETQFRSIWGQSLSAAAHGRSYELVLGQARRAVADPSLQLVLVHFPVPHPPYFYNRLTGKYDYRRPFLLGALSPSQEGYWHALALVDRTVGELRQGMDSAGLWDTTSVLLTSDHHLRNSGLLTGLSSEDRRVPFLLRLAGQSKPVVYRATFNTVLTSDLLLAVLKGELADHQGVAGWLDAHRSIGRSPYDE